MTLALEAGNRSEACMESMCRRFVHFQELARWERRGYSGFRVAASQDIALLPSGVGRGESSRPLNRRKMDFGTAVADK